MRKLGIDDYQALLDLLQETIADKDGAMAEDVWECFGHNTDLSMDDRVRVYYGRWCWVEDDVEADAAVAAYVIPLLVRYAKATTCIEWCRQELAPDITEVPDDESDYVICHQAAEARLAARFMYAQVMRDVEIALRLPELAEV